MEDIFCFQKIYQYSDNFDIIDYKKILEYKNINLNLNDLKYNFYQTINNNDNDNYIISIKNFLIKFNLFYFDNIYNFLSNFDFNLIEKDLVDYNFVKNIHEIDYDILILKYLYEKKIILKNNNDLKNLFKFIKLENNTYLSLYKLFYDKFNVDLYKNINKIEEIFKKILESVIFINFYKVIFSYKKLNDYDLVYYLLKNNYEMNIDKFVDLYNDIKIDNQKFSFKGFYVYYIKNFSKFNVILSEKFFFKMYNDFDINFFNKSYSNIIKLNKINTQNILNIYNFYHKNNDLISNKNELKNKYENIDIFFLNKIYLIEIESDKYENFILNNDNFYHNITNFMENYKEFDLNIFLLENAEVNNNFDIIKKLIINKNNEYNFIYDENNNLEFIKTYYNYKNLNLYDINILFNNTKEYIKNYEDFKLKFDINIELIKLLNQKLLIFDESQIIKEIINKNYIINYTDFLKRYLTVLKNNSYFNKNEDFNNYYNEVKKINTNDKLLNFMIEDIYKSKINNGYIGRKNVFLIEEVLIDLKLTKPKLDDGISLIIRAKNEEKNIKICIESVVDLVDEIIFVNNNSTDNTLQIIEELELKYKNIKVYNYFINVNRVGIEHENALKVNDKNTLGNFYNWCLFKSTKKNVIKWDADFICIRNNFKQMVNDYKIRFKNNKYALWFSGYTLFINKYNKYINLKSYYNEFRLFSYLNDFKWYDGDLCEFNEPYIQTCEEKIKILYPIFYEMKRTDLDEFNSRSSLIDKRDLKDYEILNKLLNLNKNLEYINNNLYFIDDKNINKDIKILLIVNTFDMGGSNIFIIEFYKYFKIMGYKIKIYCESIKKKITNFNIIDYNDVYEINNNNLEKDLDEYDYLFFNGFIPSKIECNLNNYSINKVFITHSDVAYSNYYIKKYHDLFYKILTVNSYTKEKLERFLFIDDKKINKIINYKEIDIDNLNINENKNKIFGVITRFSEDKNITMLLFALKKIFEDYKDYKFYLVGYENNKIQSYLKYIINYLELEENIIIEGYQSNTKKYYNMFDFVILPSVSEGTSYNLIESMSYKKLLVVSNVGGNNELLEGNCIYINYDKIKDYEYRNLYIENYNEQLNLLGYYTIDNYNKFSNNIKIKIDYNLEDIKNIPSIFINLEESYLENHEKEKIINRQELWNMNCEKIYTSIKRAINIDIDDEKILIENNFNKIKDNYNLIEYYKNIDYILNYN